MAFTAAQDFSKLYMLYEDEFGDQDYVLEIEPSNSN